MLLGTSDQPAPAPVPRRRFDVSVRTLVLVPLTAAVCVLLVRLMPVVLALILALMIMGTLNPAVRWLERHHIKRTWATVLMFVAVLIVSVGLMVLTLAPLIAQVESLVSQEPQLRERVADMLSHSKYSASFADRVRHFEYSKLVESTGPQVLTASRDVLEWVTYGVSAIFLALYMMIDRDRLRGGVFAVVPRAYHLRFARILLNLETIVGGYIRGQALTCALMAVFTFVLLLACRVPNAMALAAFAGFADLLPYVGALLAIGPAALTATSRGLPIVLIVVAVMTAYQEFESRVIVPRVYGRVLRLPSAVVLLALLAGGVLGGIMGALLALPAAAAIRMLFVSSRVLLPGEQVDDEHLRMRDEQAERAYAERTAGAPADQASAVAMELSQKRLQEEGELALETPMTSGLTPTHDVLRP